MNATAADSPNNLETTPPKVRRVNKVLASLDALAGCSANLVANHDTGFRWRGEDYRFARYTFIGPQGGDRHLNHEFWKNSTEPEIRFLEAELSQQTFDGLIALHTDADSKGFYAFARGTTLARQLLRPALESAAQLLPINQDERIDGFHACEGLIEDGHDGMLKASPKSRPKPFEITLETPGQTPSFLREAALVFAVRSILEEYRKFIAYAANL